MKIRYIILSLLGIMLMYSSCNDDFMQQDPEYDLAEPTVFKQESDLRLFLDGLYKLYIEGHKEGLATERTAPDNVTGSQIINGDVMSDNVIYAGVNPDARLTMRLTTPTSGSGMGWEWEKLKKVNYFLRRHHEVPIDSEKLKKYTAEAYFFKAMDYYNKMYALGEVPWLVYDLNIDSPELYSKRTPRAELADSVLMCLDYAVENLADTKEPYGVINRDMALFLKARFCLFEGTFRKYHKLGLDDKKFLEAAADAAKEIIDSQKYELYNKEKRSYFKLFGFKKDPISDGNKEAIMARVYNGLQLGHSNQRFHEMNNHTRYCMGASLSLLEDYLCEDGRPIYIGGTEGNYEVNPLFKGYDGLWEELLNRDPRVLQTISKPGINDDDISSYELATGRRGLKEVGIIYPDVTYPVSASAPLKMYGTTVTGYRFIKHWMGGDLEQREAHQKGTQTALIFRYGELLLIYAEAKAELNQITQLDLDITINALRTRAGFDFVKYPKAKLTLGSYVNDPRLDDIYRQKLDYSVSPLLREIRRERRVELALEGTRREDLIRWRAGNLLTVPMRGMKFTKEKQKIYESTKNEQMNTALGVKETVYEAILGRTVYVDDKGFIYPFPTSIHISNGILPWNDRAYYYPIPKNELILNENLTQNPGWEDPR